MNPLKFEEPFSDGEHTVYAVNDVTIIRVTTSIPVSGVPVDVPLAEEINYLFDQFTCANSDFTEGSPHRSVNHPAMDTLPEPLPGPCKTVSQGQKPRLAQYVEFQTDDQTILKSEALLFDVGGV